MEFVYLPFFFHHYLYLNGKQILFDLKSLSKIMPLINDIISKSKVFYLSSVREILGDIIPHDAKFVNNEKEIDKDEEASIKLFEYMIKYEIIT